MASTDDSSRVRHGFERQALESRQIAIHALSELDAAGEQRNQFLVETPYHQRAQTLVMEYVSYIAPKAPDIEEFWTSTVETIELPDPLHQRIEVGQPNAWGEIDYSDAEVISRATTSPYEVSLQTAHCDWGMAQHVTITAVTDNGRVIDQFSKRMALPPAALSSLFTQVDMCLNELGWLPETREDDPHGVT